MALPERRVAPICFHPVTGQIAKQPVDIYVPYRDPKRLCNKDVYIIAERPFKLKELPESNDGLNDILWACLRSVKGATLDVETISIQQTRILMQYKERVLARLEIGLALSDLLSLRDDALRSFLAKDYKVEMQLLPTDEANSVMLDAFEDDLLSYRLSDRAPIRTKVKLNRAVL